MHYFIYKTTNIRTGNYYFGMHCTSNLDDGYLGSGKRLLNSIHKYGKQNHQREILEFLPDRKSLALREQEIITSNELSRKECMNLSPGGFGCSLNKDLIKESDKEWYQQKCKNMTLAQKKTYDTGKRPKIFFDWSGKKHKEETKRKIGLTNSIKQSGSRNSRYNTKWIYNLNLKKSIAVKLEEVQKYLDNGWNLGRKINFG